MHTATAAFRLVAGDDGVAAHGKGAAGPNTHTAATVRLCAVRRVAGDLAAGHVEGAVAEIYAAAAARRVAGDRAAVHIECAAVGDTHAAAGVSFSARIVTGDAAVVQIECAVDIHTPADVPVVSIKAVGDLTRCSLRFAVGQGKGHAGVHADGVKFTGRHDAVAVEAQHHAIHRLPRLTYIYIIRQVVVTRLFDVSQTGNALPDLVGVRPVRARLAADGMGMQVAVGEDDAVAVELSRIPGIAYKVRRIVLRQRVSVGAAGADLALGDGEIAVRGNFVRRGHADAGVLAQLVSDRDAPAALTQMDIVLLAVCRVAGDLHIAGNGEPFGLRSIYAAALAAVPSLGGRGVAGDLAAIHVNPAAGYAAAVATVGGIPGDAAVIHIKPAGVLYAATLVVLADRAAIHIEYIIVVYTGRIPGDGAAVQIERGKVPYMHAIPGGAGDLSVAVAVADRQS